MLSQTLWVAKGSANVGLVQRKALARTLQSLVLWGDAHNVSEGLLDATLQRSHRLLCATLSPLRSMGELLMRGTCPCLAPGVGRFGSDSDATSTAVLRQLLSPSEVAGMIEKTGMGVLLDKSREAAQGEDYDPNVDSESDRSTESSDTQPLQDALQELQIYMRCLVDLSSALDNAVPDPQYADHHRSGHDPTRTLQRLLGQDTRQV